MKADQEVTEQLLSDYTPGQWRQITVKDDKVQGEIEDLNRQFDEAIEALTKRFENKVDKLQRGDELPPGVMKMVKVFVATKRKMQPGDKMAGRHGNKGVISRLVPIEDMPHTGGRRPGRHRAQPAGRALAHERRADPGDPSGLRLQGSGQADRRGLGGLNATAKTGELKQALRRRLWQGSGDARSDDDSVIRARRRIWEWRSDRHAGVRRRAEPNVVEHLEMAGLRRSGQST